MASYVDILGGLDDTTGYKAPTRLATTVDLGTGLIGLLVIDGVQTVAGDRILVWQQVDQTTNGIYVAQLGAWTRAIDWSSSSSILEGTQIYNTEGQSFSKSVFVCQTSNPVIGSTDITFTLSTTQGQPQRIPYRRILTGTTDFASSGDGYVEWKVPTGAAKTQHIPSAASIPSGQSLKIKDGFGDCNINNITITPASGTIDGQANFVMSIRYQEAVFTSDGDGNWVVG